MEYDKEIGHSLPDLGTLVSRISHSGGAWGGRFLQFFSKLPPLPPPIKTEAPHLKMKPPSEKQLPPLKREAPFHEMIPRKNTINNNLKSS